MTDNIPKTYDPTSFETEWYKFWESKNFFHADPTKPGEPFSIVIPPPNVTGQLHMGHALDETLQDILIRYHRMKGDNTIWMPGCDHAGIATQARVEEELRKEGLDRYKLGRKKFLDRVWQWKEKYGDRIVYQLKMLGSSCDWERLRFTMDEGCSKAVREVFVSLYEEGLIYQGRRITNWCPKCNTALSDIEVDHADENSHLWHLRYPLEDDPTKFIEVATTRPETMLGDTGVAVHPDDSRYKDLIGKNVILPLMNKPIPIFADEYVDKSFGTGAVKVTPAHDPNDFEMGLRHNLEQVRVIENDGRMSEGLGKYSGLDRFECRKMILQDLEAQKVLVQTEDYTHSVGHCSRCGTTIEPLISTQWFVKMESLAKPAIEAVRNGSLEFVPSRFTKIYENWLENIRDWCISRQLWWGHRIPAWYCDDCGKISVSRTDLDECPHCHSKNIRQDEDVLDTWFSSALWPFETFGFPEKTIDLEKYYPTSVLVTGYDIIFFWVARMVMMGLKFQNDIPFRKVFIHGLVRDELGRKMSKSLGNGIDPVEIIEKYGADTLRFTLITGNTPGNDMRFYKERVESSRNFANKIWNASRFLLMNLSKAEIETDFKPDEKDLELADKWILSRFEKTRASVANNLEHFELGEAARSIYNFIWNEFCDWYIELTKSRLNSDDPNSKKVALSILITVLEKTLRLLHPFMPFITEEIWQKLPNKKAESIMISPFPTKEFEIDESAEKSMSALMESIQAIRNLRAELNVAPGKKSEAVISIQDSNLEKIFVENQNYIEILATSDPVKIVREQKIPNAISNVTTNSTIFLPLTGLIDVDKEIQKLTKELNKLTSEIQKLDGRLHNEKFLSKAPENVVESEKEKLVAFNEKKSSLQTRIDQLNEAKK